MTNDTKEAVKERENLVPWRPFPEMPKWQREMERMFGDFTEEQIPSPAIKKIETEIRRGS
jgi:hypothetical protein